MTDFEKRLADIMANNYHEEERFYPYYDRRVYLELNGVLSSKGKETDILFINYTINEEKGNEYFQLFISSPDDMYQDFIYLDDLTDEEKKVVEPLIMEQVLA